MTNENHDKKSPLLKFTVLLIRDYGKQLFFTFGRRICNPENLLKMNSFINIFRKFPKITFCDFLEQNVLSSARNQQICIYLCKLFFQSIDLVKVVMIIPVSIFVGVAYLFIYLRFSLLISWDFLPTFFSVLLFGFRYLLMIKRYC